MNRRELECIWDIGGEDKGKGPLGSRWVDNIKMDLGEM
jgi:hypothetical protein